MRIVIESIIYHPLETKIGPRDMCISEFPKIMQGCLYQSIVCTTTRNALVLKNIPKTRRKFMGV